MRYPRLVVALLLAGIGLGVHEGRRAYIRSWFRPGPHRVVPRVERPVPQGPLRPVRVVLVDGLDRLVALRLPAHDAVCRAGLELTVDVGFPTVSMPVQHVLWTGAWQQASGVQFIVTPMPRPVFESLPDLVGARGGRAVAVAEEQPWIARTFFTSVAGPPVGRLTPLALQQEALAAAQSDAALVLVHLLGVDHAGHHEGGALVEGYLAEARRADGLLADLWQVRQPDWTLLVLSDHGHHPLFGGHGGAEPSARTVRACMAGPGIAAGTRARAELPDVTRMLAERLNVAVPRACLGRSLEQVRASPPPPVGTPRQVALVPLVLALVGLAVLLMARAVGCNPALLLPWGMLGALLLAATALGAPTLSRGYVFRAFPWTWWWAGAVPLLVLPAIQLRALVRRGLHPGAGAVVLAAGVLAPAATLLLASGWPLFSPPLQPFATAWASALMALTVPSLGALALWTLCLKK